MRESIDLPEIMESERRSVERHACRERHRPYLKHARDVRSNKGESAYNDICCAVTLTEEMPCYAESAYILWQKRERDRDR